MTRPLPGAHDVAPAVTLPLARYRFTAVFDRDLDLPAFAGPLLRSVFGQALRRGACVTGAPDCTGCPLLHGCAYPAVIEPPPRPTQFGTSIHQVPCPWVMEPPPPDLARLPAGQPLQWHQVLVGEDVLNRLPAVVQAWDRALLDGFGHQRVRGRLVDLSCLGADGSATTVRAPPGRSLLPHPNTMTLPAHPVAASDQVHLHIHTPLRLQHDGRPLQPADLAPRKLAADLLRRCNLMLDLHLGIRPAPFDAAALVAHAATLTDDRSNLHWRDGARYSARQKQETPLGGVMGRWTLRGDLAPLLPWLWLGQWLHLGKGTAMGLGAYTLEVPAMTTTWFVSRHPGAAVWAAGQGLTVDRRVIHLDLSQVKAGDTVIGTLPVHLAAEVCRLGARYLHLSLDLPVEWRGRELGAAELREANARLQPFRVQLESTSPS